MPFFYVEAATLIELVIESAARSDSGIYTIKAENQMAIVEKEVNILVIGERATPIPTLITQ